MKSIGLGNSNFYGSNLSVNISINTKGGVTNTKTPIPG